MSGDLASPRIALLVAMICGLSACAGPLESVVPAASCEGSACKVLPPERGWLITVYYTAVESFHSRNDMVEVTGCPALDCSNGSEKLGEYPRTFVKAVRNEGTGRITTGPRAGRYLNWASSEGYWLDSAPRDTAGRSLEPYRTAAADGIPEGAQVRVVACGRMPDGSGAPPKHVCSAFQNAKWEIRDAFTQGLGGKRHIDLYVGEEDVPNFTLTERFTTFEDATLELELP